MPSPYNPLARGAKETCSFPCGNPEHDHSVADDWHDPRGPEREERHPNGDDALDVIYRGFNEAQDVLLRAEAEFAIEDEDTGIYGMPPE
jgi:hypothetical protein